ncbi:MAG: molybdopterin converting factor subunit 1 [Gammaproteobacteria bacterium]|jgi:molybdopterin synthase sulfur carrier subunit|uniref:molybdopterin converting factor subunit 1 n=1 Tax=Candidatus Nitrotoga sp. M5 TaxID=2890409 RepID=UPI001DFAE515|nr:molybdopterin converting factor subunit 1 [Candidatus Nitrotoga sp. M5]MBU0540008.1 molybdopterin converting factor subunit 1 [Gammaproteobacteria bacterium]MBU1834379.1 molybdopterin converting factor subunit 1 [Gammaproteobacteria bacterium]CAH1388289.1 molybdopterin synthase sulfur carrier subunit [Candidatus Nitrotoga sp. M5]
MITVLFFAKYREQLGLGRMTLPLATATTVSELKIRLVADGGDEWAAVLFAGNTLCAVNQTIAHDTDTIGDGDEVAFYPPVTGG